MSLLLAAALLLPGADTLSAYSGEADHHYVDVPYGQCALDQIDIGNVSLAPKLPKLCKLSMKQSDENCAKAGGVKMTNNGALTCRVSVGRSGTIKNPATSTGSTFPGPNTRQPGRPAGGR